MDAVASAQIEVKPDTTQNQTPTDTIPDNTARRRRTASGRTREKEIINKTDSLLSQVDTLKRDTTEKDAPQAAASRKREGKEAKGDTISQADSLALLQQSDSLLQAVLAHTTKSKFRPDPMRAMWLGLVFPGAGQIYNRKYWKLPIFYGGFLGCTYALTWNGQMLKDYSQAYLDIMDNDPNTCSYEKMLPLGYDIRGKEERFKNIFKQKKNYFRKYRDLSIFAFAGVYALAVIDAYVDAELSSFDVNRDLSIQWSPTFIQENPHQRLMPRQSAPAIQCNIIF